MPFRVFVNQVAAAITSRFRRAAIYSAYMRYLGGIFGRSGFLQGLELIDPLLGVTPADLAQGLVLVAAGLDVFGVEQVVLGLLVLVLGLFQLRTQGLQRGRDSGHGWLLQEHGHPRIGISHVCNSLNLPVVLVVSEPHADAASPFS